MGLLLMQYEYQKAKQKCNVLELKGIRLHDRQEMYTKRISNIEKLFSKKKTNLESVWNQQSSRVNTMLQQARMDSTSFIAVAGSLGSMFGTNFGVGDGFESQIMQGYDGSTEADKKSWIASQLAVAASKLQNVVQSMMEAMKQAEIEQLEALEDRQREPIAEKDAEIQAEVAENDTLMTLAKERMEAAKGHLPDTVKGSVAHYGLS